MLRESIAAALLLSAAAAHSEAEWYVGAGIGQSQVKAEDFGISLKGHDTAGQLFGGVQINPNLALEAAYIDGGTIKDEIFGLDTSLDVKALQAAVRGILPFSPMFRGYVKAGIVAWESTVTVTDGFDFESADDDGNEFSYGLGIEAGAGKGIGRLEWQHLDVDGAKWDLITLGFSWKL